MTPENIAGTMAEDTAGTIAGRFADTLASERLILRRPRASDAGPISLYAGDERVARMTARLPHPYPPGAAESFIEAALSGRLPERVWAIDASPSGGAELVGLIGVQHRTAPPGLGYWVGPPFWNTGYASEAVDRVVAHLFDDLGVAAVEADVFADNDASVRVLERNGFAELPEGRRLHSVARGGIVAGRAFRLERAASRRPGADG